jgi:beta-xylosidase
MNRFIVPLVLLILSLGVISCQKKGYQSFMPAQLWPANDSVHINAHGGGILFHEGKYYWFGEHKVAGEAGNSAQVGVHCYSSTDLYNWKNEGIALKVAEKDTTCDIVKGCVLERPKVIFNNNTRKFVMWFHLELKGKGYIASRSGVAVSDNITGPYTFLHSERPDSGVVALNLPSCLKGKTYTASGEKFTGGSASTHPDSLNIVGRDFSGGQMARDMNLFVDDDGKAYHIFASEENSTLHISQLTDDYLSHSGKYSRAFVGRFMEAPAIFKYKGKYYLIMSGCTGWAPNAARSAVADSIFGPWKELGNPWIGSDSATSFNSQSTYVLPVNEKKNAFILMGDRWAPQNAIDGRYIWQPVEFKNDKPVVRWHDQWDLSFFDKK